MEIHTNIYTPKTSISSLEQPLKPAIMRRIDRVARLAAEYADCKWMQATARQVQREAEAMT